MVKSLSISELRQELSQTLREVRSGTIEPKEANAVVNIARGYMATISLEMRYCKIIGKTPKIAELTAASPK